MTWNTNEGGQFNLTRTNQSLFVYIYNTNIDDPIREIKIIESSLGLNPPTYTRKFLDYLKPFNLIRTCFWQGQNLHNNLPLSIWHNRTLVSSSTQMSITGVALEHIL